MINRRFNLPYLFIINFHKLLLRVKSAVVEIAFVLDEFKMVYKKRVASRFGQLFLMGMLSMLAGAQTVHVIMRPDIVS
jgi:hypothetical protein